MSATNPATHARRFLTPAALAERWSITTKTLANKRVRGEGPAYTKIGGAVRYALADVECYEAAGRVEAAA